jgi:flavin-dependent dehydrogenase
MNTVISDLHDTETDVLIIGAGLAGLQCATLLARHGIRTLLVDRKRDLAAGVHTTGIFVRKTLEDFEFPAGTLGPAVRDVSLYSPRLKRVDLASVHDEFRVGKMGALYRSMLGDCDDAGVRFVPGTRYVASRADGDLTTVELERDGIRASVRTKVLVGADGARSRVAGDLGLDENREWIVGYEEVYPSEGKRGPRLHCFLDAELAPGYLAWIADDGEEIHIGVGGYSADFNPREALRSFRAKTEHLIGNAISEPLETRGGRIPVGGVLPRISCPRGLLIGDAAGAVSPLTAGGLDPALRLSRLAADVIARRLDAGDGRVLLAYSGELFRARFVSRLWMRRIIRSCSRQSLLETAFGLIRSPFGRLLARHIFFGRGSFPDITIKDRPAEGLGRFELEV